MTELTYEEKQELILLRHANEHGKFAIPMFASINRNTVEALERLQIRRWITLIDVSPIAIDTDVHRIFLLSEEAMAWKAGHDGQ